MNKNITVKDELLNPVFGSIKSLVISSRNKAYNTVNSEMQVVLAGVGHIILES